MKIKKILWILFLIFLLLLGILCEKSLFLTVALVLIILEAVFPYCMADLPLRDLV